MASIPLEQPEVLDLCASPGGKSVFAWRALKPSRLVSNEVVGKRTVQLKSNLKRCHIDAEVKSLTAETYVSDGQTFDVIIVDAPCSGQSLLAKGETAPGCFHPSNVNGCMKRQRRIVANAAQCVRDGGYLLYSTCTYSPEENEEVVEWLLKKFPEFKTVEVPLLRNFQSRLTEEKCYRFFPDKDYGAGGFTALLKKG